MKGKEKKQYGINFLGRTQAKALWALTRPEHEFTKPKVASVIAARIGMYRQRSSVYRTLRKLEQYGLVSSRPLNGRSRTFVITPKGRKVLNVVLQIDSASVQ